MSSDVATDGPPRVPVVAALLLLVVGQCLHGILLGPLLGAIVGLDPTRGAWVEGTRGVLVAVVVALLGGVLAVLPAVAALGIALRQEWGRPLALVAATLWLPTGCAPVAGLVLMLVWGATPPESPEAG